MMLAIGTKPELKVGDLPRPVAEYLGCHPAVVFLGYKEFQKIAKKHDKIRREEFQTLPIMIKKGRYIKDAGRRNCVTVFYSDPDSGNIYTAGIKSACQGGEVWIQTFFRTTERKAENRERKHGLLHEGS